MTAETKRAFNAKLEYAGLGVMDELSFSILDAVEKNHSISKAARKLRSSYKFVWGRMGEMERTLKQPVVAAWRGGYKGGGGARLTPFGTALLKEYHRAKEYVTEVMNDTEYWEAIGLKISARNRLKGSVKDIVKGVVTASVKIELKTPVTITTVITKEAAEDLNIKLGDTVEAVIKSTDVMIAKE